MKDESRLSLVAIGTTRRQMMAGCAALAGMTMTSVAAAAVTGEGISRVRESIHQEPVFKASRSQLYRALTDPQQFDQVTRLSAAAQSIATGARPTEISGELGGAFTLFGGYIVGRHLDLMPNERIVQAWRAQSWKPGEFSIVSFDLVEEGASTKIVFDHNGFPQGQAEHLAGGWKGNYWEPLEKYLLAKK